MSCWIPCNFNLGECHTIISRKPNEHCNILHYETSKSKKAFSFCPKNPVTGSHGIPRLPYLGAPLKFVLAPLGLKFWHQHWDTMLCYQRRLYIGDKTVIRCNSPCRQTISDEQNSQKSPQKISIVNGTVCATNALFIDGNNKHGINKSWLFPGAQIAGIQWLLVCVSMIKCTEQLLVQGTFGLSPIKDITYI